MPLEVFISYSHKDQALRDELETHLANLKRQQVITSWYDGKILPGTQWEQQIFDHLNRAQIILLLISADFLASDFCYSIEMEQALTKDTANQARVIPIILRPTDWQDSPFSHLQALPTGGKPVIEWPTHDAAFLDIVQGLRRVITDLQEKLPTVSSAPMPHAAHSTRASKVQPSIWNVPYRRNPFFTGREEVLHTLHETLSHQSTTVVSQVQTQAINGLGGIGRRRQP